MAVPTTVNTDHVLALRYMVIALATVVIWEHLILFADEAAIWAKIYQSLFRATYARRRASREDIENAQRGVQVPKSPTAANSPTSSFPRHGSQIGGPGHAVKPRLNPADFAVLFLRYTNIGLVVSSLFLLFGRPPSCSATLAVVFFFFNASSLAVNTLFAFRVYLLFSRNIWILLFLSVLIATDLAFWLIISIAFNAVEYPLPAPEPYCGFPLDPVTRFKYPVVLAYPNFALQVTYDSVVLFLTLFRLGTLPSTIGHGAFGASRDQQNEGRVASWRRNAKLFVTNLLLPIIPISMRPRLLGMNATTESRLPPSQATAARSYLIRSNLLYYAICFAITLVAFLLNRYVGDVYISLIGTAIGFVMPPIIAVRVVLSTPSRNEQQQLAVMQQHQRQFRHYQPWRQPGLAPPATESAAVSDWDPSDARPPMVPMGSVASTAVSRSTADLKMDRLNSSGDIPTLSSIFDTTAVDRRL